MSDEQLDDEQVQPEDKLYLEYLSVWEYEWKCSENEGMLIRTIGYVIHECEECIMVATVLVKQDEGYYLSAEIVTVDVENIKARTLIKPPVDTQS